VRTSASNAPLRDYCSAQECCGRANSHKTTTNQRRDQQKWAAVVVTATATAMAAATMVTRWHDGDATMAVMDGNGRCDGNATASKVMQGTMATQWQWEAQQQHQ
jgi:hypothetical protein